MSTLGALEILLIGVILAILGSLWQTHPPENKDATIRNPPPNPSSNLKQIWRRLRPRGDWSFRDFTIFAVVVLATFIYLPRIFLLIPPLIGIYGAYLFTCWLLNGANPDKEGIKAEPYESATFTSNPEVTMSYRPTGERQPEPGRRFFSRRRFRSEERQQEELASNPLLDFLAVCAVVLLAFTYLFSDVHDQRARFTGNHTMMYPGGTHTEVEWELPSSTYRAETGWGTFSNSPILNSPYQIELTLPQEGSIETKLPLLVSQFEQKMRQLDPSIPRDWHPEEQVFYNQLKGQLEDEQSTKIVVEAGPLRGYVEQINKFRLAAQMTNAAKLGVGYLSVILILGALSIFLRLGTGRRPNAVPA